MDPNEALRLFREALTEYYSLPEGEGTEAADRALEAAEALDGWLTRGGFLPTSWAGACPTGVDSGAVL